MNTNPTRPESVGIAQTIVLQYFPMFMRSREEVIQFYENYSVLTWNGQSLKGPEEIRRFFKELPQITFQVGGFEVQSVPDTSLWTLLVVFGTVEAEGNILRDFHSTFYIESVLGENRALIKYHTFQTV